MEGKKILITGASGQCGRAFAFLLSKKNEVHALARFSSPRIREEIQQEGCVVWQVDMATESPEKLPSDFDVVLHEAVDWGGDDDLSAQNRSFHLSCEFVGDLMYRNHKAVFALVSTGSVYKRSAGLCKEDETPVMPRGNYCLAKVCMTQVARWVGRNFGRPWVELRYWFPFAPYQRHQRVDTMLRGELVADPSDIHQRTYISNHVHNTLKALAHARPEGEIFNSATTEVFTAADLARLGAKLTGVAPDPRALEPAPPSAAAGHVADMIKLRRLIGPSAISLEEGLRRYIRGMSENVQSPQEWMFEEEA